MLIKSKFAEQRVKVRLIFSVAKKQHELGKNIHAKNYAGETGQIPVELLSFFLTAFAEHELAGD